MGSRRKVPRYRNPSAAHEAKATLYAKPRDPINPVLSSDRAEMSPEEKKVRRWESLRKDGGAAHGPPATPAARLGVAAQQLPRHYELACAAASGPM